MVKHPSYCGHCYVLPPLGLEREQGKGIVSRVQTVAVVTGEDHLTDLMAWVEQQASHRDRIGRDPEL